MDKLLSYQVLDKNMEEILTEIDVKYLCFKNTNI